MSAAEQPTLEPVSADISIVGECSVNVVGAAALETGPSGTLAAWVDGSFEGGEQFLVRRVDAP
jgi:hypothetical protein